MQPSQPVVSLISIHYNHISDTIEFLESAKKLTYPNVEIIVIDNGSMQEPMTNEVINRFPGVIFIRSEKNLGFAGGNNIGLRKAKGDYLFLLNNDTLLPVDFLEGIISFMESHPEAGMASPKVLYPDGVTLQYAGALGINKFTGRGKRLGLFEKDSGQYDKIYKTDLGHGAALIIRRKAYEEVGPMPEVYFLYYEEHDWCEQVKRRGYDMYYLGTSHIIHKESISTGGDESPLKVYYLIRNRLLFHRRNVSGFPFFAGLLFFMFIAAPRNLGKYLLKGKTKLFNAGLRGIWWNIKTTRV